MDYLALFKRAWHITIKYKFLWLFGLFLGVFQISSGMNFNFSGYNFEKELSIGYRDFQNFFTENITWIAILSLALLFFILILIFLKIISEGSLIASVNQIEEKEKINFIKAVRLGLQYFWKIFAIKLLIGILIAAVFIILVTPTIALFLLNMPLRGFALLFLDLVILIPLLIAIFFIKIFSCRFAIIKNQSIFQSIKSGLSLLKENISPSIIIALILFGINVAIALALTFLSIFLIFIFGVPALFSFIAGISLKSTLTSLAGIPLLGLTITTLSTLLFLINAIFNAYSSILWTLVFRNLTVGFNR